jgi:hypothetical protein
MPALPAWIPTISRTESASNAMVFFPTVRSAVMLMNAPLAMITTSFKLGSASAAAISSRTASYALARLPAALARKTSCWIRINSAKTARMSCPIASPARPSTSAIAVIAAITFLLTTRHAFPAQFPSRTAWNVHQIRSAPSALMIQASLMGLSSAISARP